ncbi:S-layer homology domain-containing protein [Paenibacillus frigoriresistens]|uniref:S-layer homology domain-containing protein n=1 Tax=Paenibacillus alginolyticus TaxID=59839 RepID=UPI0015679E35|nr:S-layer homology domain-containing protein [Paenibacillus frigoriresistens]NRF96245.1 S-layer homology domain-containing protein [Paenibacillus frigoriresistens]
MQSKRTIKKISLILLSWCLLVSVLGGMLPAYANGVVRGQVTIPQAIDEAAGYILTSDGNALTDWDAYALAKAGKPLTALYLSSISAQLQQNGGHYSSVTDYDRIVLAVKAAGGNPEQIPAGSNSYNFIQNIYDSDGMTAQGTNGAIYSLLALSSGNYNIPLTAKWNPGKITAWLMTQKNADGGWPLAAGGASSVDITAAAINALSTYKTLPGVQQAIDGGIQWLSSHQLMNGGFSEYGENAESTAQVILALSTAGIDARSPGFTKANGNPLSYLFNYRQNDGGFAHVSGGASNSGATGQVLMALAAYQAFTGGNSGSYDAVLTDGNGAPSSIASVTVHIAGPNGMIADGPAIAVNAYDAVIQVLQRSGISFHEGSGHYIDTVNGIVSNNDSYWLYNVKRQGMWDYANANNSGLDGYVLRNGDDIYLYYSGSDTALVKSIAVNPALPVAGQALQVTVKQAVYDWGYGENDTVASNVYVELGGQKVQTDSQGVALFPSGLQSGTYKAVVTGYRTVKAPKIVTDSTTVTVGTASLQIEGSSSTYAVGTANTPNLLDSAGQLLTNKNVPFQIVNSSFGPYVKSIGSDADSWSYAVYRQGEWNIPTVGMADYTLQPGDQAVIYYSGYDASWNPNTYLVDSITLNPPQPKANESFTVTVNKTLGFGTPSPAAGIQVKIGGLIATTDSQGAATFAGLADGTYILDISGYVTGAGPKIVHTSQTLTIQPRIGLIGPVINPFVYLSVTGESNRTLLPSTSVALQNGDTPYSVLIRTLGAGRVQSSGSGSTAYVQGIDGMKEFDRGAQSGWMYAINCSYPNVGADSVYLKSGDSVAWGYTLNGGKDLNACTNPGGITGIGATAALTDSVITDALQKLDLSYNNQKPIEEIAKSAVVINSEKIMTADAADALKKELAANTVNEHKTAMTDSATVIADAMAEIKLQIPVGAIQETKEITVSKLPASERDELVSMLYEFGPSGLTFGKPVQISIKTPIAAESLDQLALVWLNEQTGRWIPIPAVIDAHTGIVTGLVNHFTKFAVINKSKLAAAEVSYSAKNIGSAIERASKWLEGGTELSDWSAYAMSKAGAAVPTNYLSSVEAKLKENGSTIRNVTDYERLALSVQAAGGNPESIGGYNLIERIYNNERMEVQGSNGPIYALLALNSGTYRIPSDAKWPAEKLLQWILDAQNAEGSWPLSKGETGNPDLTAAALSALAPYKEQALVKTAIDKAVRWLGSVQSEDGGFALDGVENAESTAQVIWGLSISGTDPVNSPYFKSGSSNMLAYLLGLQLSSGAFPHQRGGESEVMATEQALMAMGAYQSFLNPANQSHAFNAPDASTPSYADQADIAFWAKPFVQKASIYKIMEGTGGAEPMFEPKKPITRIQFAVMLLRILGEAPSAEGKTDYVDVAPDSWYAGYVAKAVTKGITDGVSVDHFAPEAVITRQEMAIMLSRSLHLSAAGTDSPGFIDMNQSYPEATPYIQAVKEKGLMEGDSAGQFLPLDSATREMAAAVAVRAYELKKRT